MVSFQYMWKEKKCQLVCYMRIDPEDPAPLTYNDVLKEKKHFDFLQPENIYRIEEIDGDLNPNSRNPLS